MSYGNYPLLTDVKRILVVKMRHHGDVLLTSPVFASLKRAIPSAEIDAFIYKDSLAMLEGHLAISNFLLYDRVWKDLPPLKKIAKEIQLFLQIRKKKYDLVVNLTEGDRGAIAAWVSGSKIRVGFDAQKKGFLAKNKMYTHVVKHCPHPRHTVERQLDALRRIGISLSEEDKELFFSVPDSDRANLCQRLQSEGITMGNYVVLHPVSRWRYKCLAIDQMVHFMKALHKRGERMVISASSDPHEAKMVEEILEKLPGIPVVNLAGKMTLKELGALIQGAKVLVTVDSVPLHMASALKTPVLVFFGPTSEVNWGPWRHPSSKVLTQPFSCRPCYQDGCGGSKKSDCLLSLSLDQMIKAFEELNF